jgi:hypothetical protein
MAKISISLRTDFPDSLDLRGGVILTAFGKLKEDQDCRVILRVFLNEAPYILINRQHIVRTSRPEVVANSRIMR